MRDSIQEWIKTALTKEEVQGKHVLEVGSMNVNGSVRPYIESLKPKGYWATDMREGLGVDQVIDCQDLAKTFGYDSYDIVVCCEMLEHAEFWQDCIWNMVAVLRSKGILIITTVMPGFPKHDFPNDYHRFVAMDIDTELQKYMLLDGWTFDYDDQYGIFIKATAR